MLSRHMATIAIYLTVACVVASAIFFIRSRLRRCTIPGPKGWPFVGIYPSLGHEIFKDFAKLSKKYGDIYSCRLCTADAIVINKYEIVDDLFRKRQGTFNDRFIKLPDTLDIPIGFGELHYGDKWKEMRSFTINVLNNQNLGDRTFEDLLNEEVSHFRNYVINSHGQKAFKPKRALLHCMGNILLTLVFRKRMDYKDSEMDNYTDAAHNLAQCLDPFIFFGVPSVFQILGRFNIIPIKKLRMSQLALDKISTECHGEIAAHQKVKTVDGSRDFVDVFLEEVDSKKEEKTKTFLTENTLKGIASNLFAAGLDSTATMLIWFVLLLTKHQDVQKKLREEVDAVIGRDRLPTLKDRDSMHYVKALMQEAHRFVSVAPMGMFHMSATDAEWQGYFIPKGTYLIANYWGMHHDERLFPNPSEFNPERFLNESGEFVKSKYVTPYGIGKRICPGEVLAQRELFLFVTQLVQTFDMQPAEGVIAKSMNSDGVYDGVGFFPPEFEARFLTL